MLKSKGLKLACAGALVTLGLILGFSSAVNLSEEDRRRIRKAVFELRELPRRILV
jgi:hypothetical protein